MTSAPGLSTSRLRSALLATCLVLMVGASPAAFTAEPFADRLQKADAVRSADPVRFKALLAELNAEAGAASAGQREHLGFLNAYALAYGGEYDEAIALARGIADTASDTALRFRAGVLVVNSYAITREFYEGLRYLDGMLALTDQIEDRALRHLGLGVAALLYNQLGQHELGRHYADTVLADQPDARTRCYAGLLRVEALQYLAQLPRDDVEINAVIAHCVEHRELLLANLVRAQLARKWAGEGKSAQAADMLAAHLVEVEATRYPRLIGEIHSLLAEYRLAQGEPERAEAHARSALAYSSAIAYSLPLVMAHKVLYESALLRGRHAEALDHFRSYAEADRAYLDEIKARELAVQLARHETLQKTHTIELLSRQNQVLQLEQNLTRQAATSNRMLLAAVLALLASLSFWAYRAKRMQLALKKLAETDALTGVSNRHHFTAVATAMLQGAARTGVCVALITFDLDNFKLINDQHGHATGDWVLRQVAAVCGSQVAANACFGRVGGEEFAVIMDGAGVDGGRDLAMRLRESISAIDLPANGASLKVSASFGVSSTAHSGYSLERLMAQADEVLYTSKKAGRNCVSVYPPATETPASATSCASQIL
jgi:diguanylate cyclase (GGDEF)-like protein